jgi:hypothetical protein
LEKAEVKTSYFLKNSAANEVGALSFELIDVVEVEGCSFTENSAGVYTGAVGIYQCNDAKVTGSSFNTNTAGLWSGAMNIEETGTAAVSSCTFMLNKDICDGCEVSAKVPIQSSARNRDDAHTIAFILTLFVVFTCAICTMAGRGVCNRRGDCRFFYR